jgi:cytochrome P450
MTSHHSFLGAAFDPSRVQVEALPDFYARLRQEEPITFNPILDAYLVSRYEDIRSIVLQPDLFSSKDASFSRLDFYPEAVAELEKGYPLKPITFVDDGQRHTRLRTPLQKAFSPARVRTMEPVIREMVARLIDGFVSNGQAEIISQLASLLPLEVILIMVGIPQQDMAMVKKRYEDLCTLITLPSSLEVQVECARQLVALQHYLVCLIEEKQKQLEEDLISELVRDRQTGEEPPSDADLINQIVGVMIAGHGPVTHLIGNGLVLMLEDPMRWQTLCEHPEYIPLVTEEILRLCGPAKGIKRTTTREVTIGGVTLPQGANLVLLCASGNRDESQFPQACRFEMQRRPNPHLTLGHGIHFCAGAALARLEGRITFEILTQRIPRMRLVPDQQFEYDFRLSNSGHKHIYVQWG